MTLIILIIQTLNFSNDNHFIGEVNDCTLEQVQLSFVHAYSKVNATDYSEAHSC